MPSPEGIGRGWSQTPCRHHHTLRSARTSPAGHRLWRARTPRFESSKTNIRGSLNENPYTIDYVHLFWVRPAATSLADFVVESTSSIWALLLTLCRRQQQRVWSPPTTPAYHTPGREKPTASAPRPRTLLWSLRAVARLGTGECPKCNQYRATRWPRHTRSGGRASLSAAPK